jgi:hypothetical protein
MRRASLLGAILLLLVATVALAVGTEELRLATLSSGGGRSVTGDSVLVGSIGQPLVGKLSEGSSQLCAGYPDCRFPEISIADDSILEGNIASATASFILTLSYATAQTVTVQYGTADGTATEGSDYLAASGTLTFTPGLTEATVVVGVLGDTEPEDDETFLLNLNDPQFATLTDSQAVGLILDDEGEYRVFLPLVVR